MRTSLSVYPALTLVVAACGGDLELSVPDPCNPLGASTHCMVPWPSAVYESPADTETGVHLDYPDGALPVNIDGVAIDPALFANHDGFSSAAPAMIAFDVGVDGSNLVHFSEYASSLTNASPTVVIDLSTGELVPHFAELDVRGADTPGDQALFIRPGQMLKGSTRYAVAIKKTLKAKDGSDLPVSAGFKAILDGETTTHPLLEKVRGSYDDIFAALAEHGIEKTDLVVAWDFTTRSRSQVQSDLLTARARTLAAAGTDGANLDFTVESSEAHSDTRFARRIDGTYKAPLFLTNNGSFAPSTTIQRDGEGKPMTTSLYDAPFTAIIPQCAVDSPTPVGLMIYGHGLLGTADQVNSSGTRHAAAEACVIAIGTDMRGMSSMDVPNVVLALNDANKSYGIFDVLVQGMMNHIALVQIARGPMATRLLTDNGMPTGRSLVDPSKVYYYGISQGGIMGTTVCAIDPVIKRCVVQVGAINYSILLERSRDWPQYRTTLIGAYPNNFEAALMISLLQQEWDRTEPTAVADVITNSGFPDTPAKEVFMQIAMADDEVSNVASDYQARTMGIPTILPSPYVPYGTETTDQPTSSGLIIYDFGEPAIPRGNEAPPDNDVHSSIRNKSATTQMMKRFFETGEIIQLCTAPKGCDCTVAGGCGNML